jgi:hypothetical protein
MAKVATKTSIYEIRSVNEADSIFVTERALIKLAKVGANGTLRSSLTPTAVDNAGRLFERVGSVRFRCIATGELFSVIDKAPSIRKSSM